MSEDMTPIVRGAKYRDVSHGETHGDIVRVKSVWIDEDETTQVSLFTEDETLASGKRDKTTVDYQSFIDRIDDTLIRVNTDHEAWEWRN
jgi:hypothetical protein